VRGAVFAIALRALFPPALNRIFDGWQSTLVDNHALADR
jgi:hypothetical protein